MLPSLPSILLQLQFYQIPWTDYLHFKILFIKYPLIISWFYNFLSQLISHPTYLFYSMNFSNDVFHDIDIEIFKDYLFLHLLKEFLGV